eukprot:scaffold46365_cov33-Phaeocystis_antarctica.AAC.1
MLLRESVAGYFIQTCDFITSVHMTMTVGAAAALWLVVRWRGVLYAEEAHPFDVGHRPVYR